MSELTRPPLVTLGCTISAAENIVAWLKPAVEGRNPDQVALVERHIGQFNTPDEVKRHLSAKDGCVRVAALRIRDITNRNGMTGMVTWAAYVMTTDAFGYPRDARAEVIVGKVARRLSSREAVRGMKAERMAASISADNLYSGSVDSLGVTLWAVVWEQEFRLDEDIDLNALPDFLRLGATFASGENGAVVQEVINVRENTDEQETD